MQVRVLQVMQVKFRFFVTVLLKGVFFLHVPSAYCDPDSSPPVMERMRMCNPPFYGQKYTSVHKFCVYRPEESYWLSQVLSYSSRLPELGVGCWVEIGFSGG